MRKEIIYQDKKISYTIKGEGSLVILLHGFGEDGNIWKNQETALANFRLLIPDIPGSGNSEMIDDMSMEGLADCLYHIVSQEFSPSQSLTLIGHSMGGYITLAFAEKYPEILRSFGLFHSSAYADSHEKIQARKKGIEFIEKHGATGFLRTSIPNLYSPFNRENNPAWIEDHLAGVHNFSGAALGSYYESMINRPDRTGVLKNSKVPVLFILGKYDTAVSLKDGMEQCYLPSISYIHVLENSGHMGMIEEPNQTNTILDNFIHFQT